MANCRRFSAGFSAVSVRPSFIKPKKSKISATKEFPKTFRIQKVQKEYEKPEALLSAFAAQIEILAAMCKDLPKNAPKGGQRLHIQPSKEYPAGIKCHICAWKIQYPAQEFASYTHAWPDNWPTSGFNTRIPAYRESAKRVTYVHGFCPAGRTKTSHICAWISGRFIGWMRGDV